MSMPPMLIEVAEEVAAADAEVAVELMPDIPDMFMVVDIDVNLSSS